MPKTDPRTYQLKLIHMAKRDLAMSDEDYRAVVRRISGGRTDSSGQMTDPERRRLLHHFRVTCQWSPKQQHRRRYSPASSHKARHQKTQADKIRAIWISLGKAGVVRQPTEAALGKLCFRLTKKHSPDWLRHDEAVTVITALETWARREGVPEAVGL
jgi:phage gp16-like protein